VITSLPYTIAASGNYELQDNLSYTGTNVAITVNAANVVVNLRGFSITRTGTPDNSSIGVSSGSSIKNVTVSNGMISGFGIAVSLSSPQSRALNLQLINNTYGARIEGNDCAVKDCFVIGTGRKSSGIGVLAEGVQVSGNQVSECGFGLGCTSLTGSAFIHNYVANCATGLTLSINDYYQGNTVTNCTKAFNSGNAIGTENGGY
jgi:hypothetical protein